MNAPVKTPEAKQQVTLAQPAQAPQLPATTSTPPMKELAAMPIDKAIDALGPQFAAALPAHIPMERFRRVVMTAISSNPDLATADRRSLFNSAVKAAQDGLLPDGRDGALIVYRTRVKIKDQSGERYEWVNSVQWQRMIAGVRKLIRNSGEIADLWAEVVYAKDQFDYRLGLDRDLVHKPAFTMKLKDRGEIIAAYSVARFKDGGISFDVMSADEIWDTWRKASKQRDKDGNPTGMWKDYLAEAFKKTVVKRHAKQLPMSTDLDDLVRDDEELYDFKGASDGTRAAEPTPSRPRLTDYTDVPQQAEDPQPEQQQAETVDAETGEVLAEAEGPVAEEPAAYGNSDAYNDGELAFLNGKPRDDVPPKVKQLGYEEAWQAGWDAGEEDAKAKAAQAQPKDGKLV